MTCSRWLTIAILLASLLGAPGQVDADWTLLQEMAGEQRTLSQQMVKEFFYIAQGMHVAAHKVTLKQAMDEFEVHEEALMYGDPKAPFPGQLVKIVAPPTLTILPGLKAVKAEWDLFKPYLAEALSSTTPNMSTIHHVVEEGAKLLKLCEDSLLLYKDAALGLGVTVDSLRVETAKKQVVLSQTMTIQALEVFMGYNLPASREKFTKNMAEFASTHQGLLRGVAFLGLGATTNMCTLWQMREVTKNWEQFRLDGQKVVELTGEDQEVAMGHIADWSVPLLTEMGKAVDLYHWPIHDCNPPMVANDWVQV